MKKLIIAAICCGALTLCSTDSAEAMEKQQASNITQTPKAEVQELDFWSHEMHKIFGRRRNRGDDNDDYHRPPPPPPPPRYRQPPPPPHRGYPPPPPRRRPGGPPPRHHAVQDIETSQLAAVDNS